jgi:arylsulfate sulfotransferase
MYSFFFQGEYEFREKISDGTLESEMTRSVWLLAFIVSATARAAMPVALHSSAQPPLRTGTVEEWVADAWSFNRVELLYQFKITTADGAIKMRGAFTRSSALHWIPFQEGDYMLSVAVKNPLTGEVSEANATFTVESPLGPDGAPVVSATPNPLVAVYTGLCNSGTMRVLFYPAAGSPDDAQSTSTQACAAGRSISFAIAGMRPGVAYKLRHEVADGKARQLGAEIDFTTGDLPDELAAPPVALRGTPRRSDAQERVRLESYIGGALQAVAFNNDGTPVWYYHDPAYPNIVLYRPLAGGTLLLAAADGSFLREIDLAGNIIRGTDAAEVSSQLRALGYPGITGFHHEAIRLPDGRTAALAGVEQLIDQGDGPVNVVGDMIVVLDADWQVSWVWNAFDKLNVKRKATLNEVCGNSCAGAKAQDQDWTHSNSLQRLPDGNLLLSIRHQDWVIKIDYRDGAGSGDVLWRLGRDGDFSTDSADPYPWFSHQHFAVLADGSMTLFDNGNTRVAEMQSGNSRGQVWRIDEQARRASLTLNADLGVYSFALGSAQPLADGSYDFLAGAILDQNDMLHSASIEIVPDSQGSGVIAREFDSDQAKYRTFLMRDLYTPPQ